MDNPTDDELLADAIAYAALDWLDQLADAPEDRSRFLLDLLALFARHGSGEAAAAITLGDHWARAHEERAERVTRSLAADR